MLAFHNSAVYNSNGSNFLTHTSDLTGIHAQVYQGPGGGGGGGRGREVSPYQPSTKSCTKNSHNYAVKLCTLYFVLYTLYFILCTLLLGAGTSVTLCPVVQLLVWPLPLELP